MANTQHPTPNTLTRRHLLFGTLATAVVGGTALAQHQPQGKALAQRLADLQTPEGAILMPGTAGERWCNPYFANWGVYGLLLGAPPRSRSVAASVSKNWIAWYTAHLNKDGTIDDHKGPTGALKATGKYDSSDAYAATFLSAAFAYHEQTGDAQTLIDRYPLLLKIAEAALLTQQRSGLTNARPDFPVAYLMDNLEVWQGLGHFARLSRNLRKRQEHRRFTAEAEKLFAAIEQWFWTPTEGVYAWALHPNGKRDTGIDRWYPGMMANLMAIAVLPVEERRDALLKRLEPQLNIPEKIDKSEPLERFIWWALAAIPNRFQDTLEQTQVKLSRVEWDKIRDLNPALIGHALRIGKGQLTPQELL